MKIFKYVKSIGGLIVGAGVGLVVESVLKDNIIAPRSSWKKLLMKVGILSIAGFAATKVIKGFEDDVDDAEKMTIEIAKEINKSNEDSKQEEA